MFDNLFLGLCTFVTIVFLSCGARAEKPLQDSSGKWHDPEFLIKMTAKHPIYDHTNVLAQGSVTLWHERMGKDIYIGSMGPRFLIGKHHWVTLQIGAAGNWFNNNQSGGLMGFDSEWEFIPHKLTLNVEGNAILTPTQRELFGWQSLDYWIKEFNVGVHSEQIGSRTLLFGLNAGFATRDRDMAFEVQYLEGCLDHERGRTFRFALVVELPGKIPVLKHF